MGCNIVLEEYNTFLIKKIVPNFYGLIPSKRLKARL